MLKGRRNVQVSREDFNLLLLIVVFVVFQDHFLSITATMMDFCWKHCATHIFYSVSVANIFSSITRYWRHFHHVKTCFFLPSRRVNERTPECEIEREGGDWRVEGPQQHI